MESKNVDPNLTGSPAFAMKVYITNRDSLTYFTLSLRESTINGTAYALLNRTGGGALTFSSVVTPLTGTLRFFAASNFSQYNGGSPDRFMLGAGFDPGNPDGTIEPPNTARKAIWEIKFRHSSDSSGAIRFDSIRTTISTLFTNTAPMDLVPNFVPGTIGIGDGFTQLIAPSNGSIETTQTPLFIWHPLVDSALTHLNLHRLVAYF